MLFQCCTLRASCPFFQKLLAKTMDPSKPDTFMHLSRSIAPIYVRGSPWQVFCTPSKRAQRYYLKLSIKGQHPNNRFRHFFYLRDLSQMKDVTMTGPLWLVNRSYPEDLAWKGATSRCGLPPPPPPIPFTVLTWRTQWGMGPHLLTKIGVRQRNRRLTLYQKYHI